MGIISYLGASKICKVAKFYKVNSYANAISKSGGKMKNVYHMFFFVLLLGNVLVYIMFVLKNLISVINTFPLFNYDKESRSFIILGSIITVIVNFITLPFLF